MQTHFVVVAERRGDATLRVLGVGFRHLAFGEAEHAARGRKFHRRAQAGNACAHHDEIGLRRKSFHNPGSLGANRAVFLLSRLMLARIKSVEDAIAGPNAKWGIAPLPPSKEL